MVLTKKNELILAGLAIVLIAVFVFYIFSAQNSGYKYSLESENVLLVSNVGSPAELLKQLGERNSFIVSSEFAQSGTTSFMTQPITLFNSVLVAQDKFVITVAKTMDPKSGLQKCDTNDGNKLENRPVGIDECSSFFSASPHVVVEVKLPNSSLPKSRVTVFESGVLIEPNSFEEVARVSFVVLKTMYADSEEIVRLINEILNIIK